MPPRHLVGSQVPDTPSTTPHQSQASGGGSVPPHVLGPSLPNPCRTLGPISLAPPAPPGAARSPQTEDLHPNRPPPSLRVPSGPPNRPGPLQHARFKDQPQRPGTPCPGPARPGDASQTPPRRGIPPSTHVQHFPLRHGCESPQAPALPSSGPRTAGASGEIAPPPPTLIGMTSTARPYDRWLLATSAACHLAPPTSAVSPARVRRCAGTA